MYSRLYTMLLNRHAWIESAKSVHQAHMGIGLFGMQGSCEPEHLANLKKLLMNQLKQCDTVDEDELRRAKNQVKAQLLGEAMDTRQMLIEHLGQEHFYRRAGAGTKPRLSVLPEEIVDAVDGVTMAQIEETLHGLMENGKRSSIALLGHPDVLKRVEREKVLAA